MGASKSQLFDTRQNELAALAKLLAHPARIAILEILAKRQACICNDIVDEVPLAQPTISQHLKELKHAGLIRGDVEGTSICYCLDTEKLKDVKGLLSNYLDSLANGSGCC
jgi:DNA-binding transcriptional ArsR family regulator